MSFRGAPYKIACANTFPQHPSWYSFEDESSVRDRDWGVGPGQYVMDVGAAYGSYTLTALAAGAEFVWAWSPQGPPGETPEADMMEMSLRENGWADRAKVYRSAVYDRRGLLNVDTQEFFEEGSAEPGHSVLRVSTLDGWYDEVQPARVDWMKLDVECAEVEVLRGAAKIIAERRPKILVENHLFKRATVAGEVRALLEGWRYSHVSTVPYHSVSHSLYVP